MHYTHDQQIKMLKNYKQTGNKKILDDLIISNKRLVFKEARNLVKTNANIDIEDLIQEGYVGLSVAANKFSFDKETSFTTYALYWIKQRMRIFVASNRSIVRLGTTQDGRKIFSSLSKVMRELDKKGVEETKKVKTAAKILGVKEESINKMMNIVSGYDVSFNSPTNDNDRGACTVEERYSEDNNVIPDIETDICKRQFSDGLKNIMIKDLTKEESFVIKSRFLDDDPLTYDEIAKLMRVSRQYVRTREFEALKMIKARLNLRYKLSRTDFF